MTISILTSHASRPALNAKLATLKSIEKAKEPLSKQINKRHLEALLLNLKIISIRDNLKMV